MARWNLENIYKKEDENKLVDEFKRKVNDLVKNRSLLKNDIEEDKFIELLEEYEKTHYLATLLQGKIGLKATENIIDQEIKKKEQQIDRLLTEEENKLIFFTHFFKNLPDVKAKKIIEKSGRFKYYLQSLRKGRKYSKSESEEQIINLKDMSGERALSSIRDLVVGKLKFPFFKEELLESEIRSKASSEDENERKEAYNGLMKVYEKNQDILGEIYKNIALDWYNEGVKIRGFESSISVRNFSNTLPDEVVQLVMREVENNKTIFQEYFKLKSNFLNIENTRHNIYAPYKLKETKKYSYEEAKKITLEVFKDFSDEMFNLAKRVFEKEHVHSELDKNKRGGAFCYSYAKDETPYVLVNHVGKLDDVSTLCHEIGHSIHGQLARNTTEFTFHSSIALAEVASIFSELLLKEKLLKEANKEEKTYLLMKELDGAFASILRQTYFVKFELVAHEKIINGTTVEELNKTYLNLLKEQFGETKVPEHFKYEWISIPHIYNSPFYCYAYSFANLVVYALYHELKMEGKEKFVPKYLRILSKGGDADVIDILLEEGFDIRDEKFWKGAFEEINLVLDEMKKQIL